MSEPLKMAGARVSSSDIVDRGYPALDLLCDFTSFPNPMMPSWDGIITNPPYGPRGKLAETFIETGLRRIGKSFLALLLPADFDSARTCRRWFGDCPRFAGKLVLTRRVKWFEHPTNPRMQP
jgi:hypothetical protein